jgi:hypothetical protein
MIKDGKLTGIIWVVSPKLYYDFNGSRIHDGYHPL